MDLFNYLDKLNWQTIIAMFAIGWYFTRDIRMALNKLDSDVREQGKRTDKLYEMFCTLQSQMKDELLVMKKEHYDFMKEIKK
jgi:hypothetical protein